MTEWNIATAARTLWQEARGEPLSGQQAVAHVLVNRVHDGRWGNTLAEVCLSEFKGIHQFSGWNRSDPNRIAACRLYEDDHVLVALVGVMQAAIAGAVDPTGGATFYYAAHMSPAPTWATDMTFCGRFGNQLFYREGSCAKSHSPVVA